MIACNGLLSGYQNPSNSNVTPHQGPQGCPRAHSTSAQPETKQPKFRWTQQQCKDQSQLLITPPQPKVAVHQGSCTQPCPPGEVEEPLAKRETYCPMLHHLSMKKKGKETGRIKAEVGAVGTDFRQFLPEQKHNCQRQHATGPQHESGKGTECDDTDSPRTSNKAGSAASTTKQ
jgi:hypothetical protein